MRNLITFLMMLFCSTAFAKSQVVLIHGMFVPNPDVPRHFHYQIPNECFLPIEEGGGWKPWFEKNKELHKKTGVKRIYLDRIFGVPQVSKIVQFGAVIQAAKIGKYKSITNRDAFMRDWLAFQKEYNFDEIIAYIGTPYLDEDFQAITGDNARRDYMSRAVDLFTSTGMSIGFDVGGGMQTGPDDWSVANRLMGIGTKVYVEPRYKYWQGLNHQKLSGIIESSSYFNSRGVNGEIESANDVIVLLTGDQINNNTPIPEMAAIIQKWIDYRTPLGRKVSVGVFDWHARRMLAAGLWRKSWVQ